MSSEEEEAYALFCSRRILKYNKYFLFIIIGIQTFNIPYFIPKADFIPLQAVCIFPFILHYF